MARSTNYEAPRVQFIPSSVARKWFPPNDDEDGGPCCVEINELSVRAN
jgi:hypothetical protein